MNTRMRQIYYNFFHIWTRTIQWNKLQIESHTIKQQTIQKTPTSNNFMKNQNAQNRTAIKKHRIGIPLFSSITTMGTCARLPNHNSTCQIEHIAQHSNTTISNGFLGRPTPLTSRGRRSGPSRNSMATFAGVNVRRDRKSLLRMPFFGAFFVNLCGGDKSFFVCFEKFGSITDFGCYFYVWAILAMVCLRAMV